MDGYEEARQRRGEIFRDTIRLCETDKTLAQKIERTRAATRLYLARDTIPKRETSGAGEITVTRERSLEAAGRLLKENPGRKIMVLNFASARHPGGGVQSGASAQEECLCRCSTLYPCLDTARLRKEFYEMHSRRGGTLYTDACVFTPGIVVLKTDTAFPEPLDSEDRFEVDILSCAAPNLRNPRGDEPDSNELRALHERRGGRILDAASAGGEEILVLGAFGCGAFRNPPEIVAAAYKNLLAKRAGEFEKIVFAVYCGGKDTRNYDVFAETLGGA